MNEGAREINRLTAEARNKAVARLRAAHPEEFRAYYREEAEARGIRVKGTREEQRTARAERLRAQLAELEGMQ